MSKYQSDLSLLPTGFVDVMPGHAEKEAMAIHMLMDRFSGFGYRRIKPPLVEFEESLLAPGPGAVLAQDTFRVMDPESHRMMGLRADITPQIARIVCSRLKDEKRPLRLTYANDVVRTRSGELRTSRQFCQVGCEYIGDDGVDSYLELTLVALMGLRDLKIGGITVDFTMPRLTDEILKESRVEPEQELRVRECLEKRDRDGLQQIDVPCKDLLLGLLEKSGRLDHALAGLNIDKFPSDLKNDISILKSISKVLPEASSDVGFDDISITFDPFENKGFEYHNGLAFTLFANGVRGELGRGGQYNLKFGSDGIGEPQQAKGFTLYMDTVLSALGCAVEDNILSVPLDTSWNKVMELQSEGWRVVRYDPKTDKPWQCSHDLENNKIIKR